MNSEPVVPGSESCDCQVMSKECVHQVKDDSMTCGNHVTTTDELLYCTLFKYRQPSCEKIMNIECKHSLMSWQPCEHLLTDVNAALCWSLASGDT